MVHLQSSKFEGIKGYAVTSLPASLSHCVTPHKQLMSTVAVYILPGVRCALGINLGVSPGGHEAHVCYFNLKASCKNVCEQFMCCWVMMAMIV